jgi:hypothetical protein
VYIVTSMLQLVCHKLGHNARHSRVQASYIQHPWVRGVSDGEGGDGGGQDDQLGIRDASRGGAVGT